MITAKQFVDTLSKFKTKDNHDNVIKYFKGDDGVTRSFGVKFGDIFKLASNNKDMSLAEINKLLDSNYYEVRMGAVSIMDYKAKDKKTTDQQKKELFDLYIKRHDRLNNWDLVDRAAPAIIGQFLIDKPKDILYKLAKSKDPWKRRTAIVSTYAFIKKNSINETFAIAEILINDKHELVNKAVGSWIREAGKKDQKTLLKFLDKHAAAMPRVTLRYAVEKLSKKEKAYYLNLK